MLRVRHYPWQDDEDEEDDDAEPPTLHSYGMKHAGAVNRVKVCPHPGHLAAAWSATGSVGIWDLTPALAAVDDGKSARHTTHQPDFTFQGHAEEGYALDWSPTVPYRMASGDNASMAHVWNRREDGGWVVDPKVHM
jgi:ribosome assembly protein RRB1